MPDTRVDGSHRPSGIGSRAGDRASRSRDEAPHDKPLPSDPAPRPRPASVPGAPAPDGADLAAVALLQIVALFAFFELPAALLGVSPGVASWAEALTLTAGFLLVAASSASLHRGHTGWWGCAFAGLAASAAGLVWPFAVEAASGLKVHVVGVDGLGLFGEVRWAGIWATLKALLAGFLAGTAAVLLTRTRRRRTRPGQTLTRTARRSLRFEGRSGVAEYLWFSIPSTLLGLALLASVAIGVQSALLDPTAPASRFVAWTVPVLWHGLLHAALLLPAVALTIRRLQDRGHGLPFLLVLLVPLVGGLVLLVVCLLPGSRGPNRFGTPEAAV